jgi:hypothetical protein
LDVELRKWKRIVNVILATRYEHSAIIAEKLMHTQLNSHIGKDVSKISKRIKECCTRDLKMDIFGYQV